MLEAMQDDTIAIIVADHGHVDVGGHGGIDRVLRDIPMAVYRRGSNISRVGTVDIRRLDEAGPATVNNLDIAPTVSALLGVSVPGAVTGTFIRPLVDAFVTSPGHRGQHWNDLYAAKWAMTDNFRRTWASAVSATMPNVSSCEVAVAAHGHCADEVAALQGLYVDVLRPGAHFRSPLWLAMLLALVLGVGSLFLLEYVLRCCPSRTCTWLRPRICLPALSLGVLHRFTRPRVRSFLFLAFFVQVHNHRFAVFSLQATRLD